jgi:hypothetical protein
LRNNPQRVDPLREDRTWEFRGLGELYNLIEITAVSN